MLLSAMVTSSGVDWRDLRNEASKESFISVMVNDIKAGGKEHFGFTVMDEKLFYKN